jgi:hypothetical protein
MSEKQVACVHIESDQYVISVGGNPISNKCIRSITLYAGGNEFHAICVDMLVEIMPDSSHIRKKYGSSGTRENFEVNVYGDETEVIYNGSQIGLFVEGYAKELLPRDRSLMVDAILQIEGIDEFKSGVIAERIGKIWTM